MLIGIKMTKVKGGPPTPSIFYCGVSGTELRAAHAKELAANDDGSRFFSCHNPMMVPLQSVPENTEDHPDHVAAQKRRAELAEKSKAAPSEIIRVPVTEGQGLETASAIIPIPGAESETVESIMPEARRAELEALKHADLRAIATGIKNDGRPIALINGTRVQLIEAILASEISTSGSELPPASETNL